MHPAAMRFVRAAAQRAPAAGVAVEFGACDVNGSARQFFPGHRFVGVDVRRGPGVDVVKDAGRFDGRGRYDLVLCTETLEHAEHPWRLVAAAERSLRPGGWLVLTAASPEREPHSVNGGAVPDGEHYAGVHPADLEQWLAGWENVEVNHSPRDGDVYAVAQRPGGKRS